MANDEKPIEYIGSAEALDMVTRSGMPRPNTQTLYNWIARYKLGVKIGGRWRINKVKFSIFLSGGRK